MRVHFVYIKKEGKVKRVLCLIVALLPLSVPSAFAGTQAGDKELAIGGSITYMDPDSGGTSTAITLYPAFHWFVTDAFSIGASLTGNWNLPDEGEDTVSYGLYFEPNYHFNTASDLVPYTGIHIGSYFVDSDGNSDTYLAYGAQGGIKYFLSEDISFKTEGRYTLSDDVSTFAVVFGLNFYW